MVANLQRFRSWFIFLSLTLTIAACGGDDDGPNPTPTPTPDDETPASFAFTSATDAALGAVVESNTVTIDDINVGVAVTIADGEYSINDGAFSSTAGVINEGDTLTLRGTAASEFSSDVVVGVTVGTVTETFTITTVAKDTAPEPFAFTARTEVPLEALLESEEAITVTGIDDEAPISISGGEYAIGEGDFTSEDGSVANGESVKVRLTSSSNFSTATTATLNIGGVTGGFTVTTLAADTTPEAFSFTSVADVALTATAESETVTILGINTTTPVSIENGEFKIGDGEYTNDAGTIENGQSIQVRATAPGTFSTAVIATLNIGGVEGAFTVTTVAQDVTPDDFSFRAVTDAPVSSAVSSATASISGITGQVAVSVQGGTYTITGSAPTTEPGVIEDGQTLFITGQSSASFATESQVTLTVGTLSRTFTITTVDQDITPDPISFDAVTDAELSTVYTSSVESVSGINDATSISISNGEYSFDGVTYTAATGSVTNGQDIYVRTTSSSELETEVQAVLNIGGVESIYSVTTLADTENPTGNIVFPTPVSLTYGATLKVRGTSEDDLSGVASIIVTVTADSAVFDTVTLDTGDLSTWVAEVDLAPDLVNTIAVSVTDVSGNTNETGDTIEITHSSTELSNDFPDTVSFGGPVFTDLHTDIKWDKNRNQVISHFGYTTSTGKIVTTDVDTGVRSSLIDIDDAFTLGSIGDQFSADGNTLYLTSPVDGQNILVADPNALTATVVSDNSDGLSPQMSTPMGSFYHESGETLYVADFDNKFYAVDLSSENEGVRTLISENGVLGSGELFVSPVDAFIPDGSESALLLQSAAPYFLWVNLATGDRTASEANSTLGSSIQFQDFDYDPITNTMLSVDALDETHGTIYSFSIENDTVGMFMDNSTANNPMVGANKMELDVERRIAIVAATDGLKRTYYLIDLQTKERVILTFVSVPA